MVRHIHVEVLDAVVSTTEDDEADVPSAPGTVALSPAVDDVVAAVVEVDGVVDCDVGGCAGLVGVAEALESCLAGLMVTAVGR